MSQDLCSPLQCNVCLMLKANDKEYHNNNNNSRANSKSDPLKILSACNGCSLIRYCGKQHQKLDWPFHQEFCKAMQKIKKSALTTHPLMLTSLAKTKEEIENTIIQLKYLLKEILKRPLEFPEEELTSFPSYCGKCLSFKNIKFICPDCEHQAYCSEEHFKEDREEHKHKCGLLQLYYTPYKTVPFKMHLEIKNKEKILNMEHQDLVAVFEKAFQVKLPEYPLENLKAYQLFSYAADFSCIGSICYALSHMDLSQTHKKDGIFVIFIIGASIEPMLWFHEHHCSMFFHQYPQIKQLELHFIGPEVMEPSKDIMKIKLNDSEKFVRQHSYRGLFQNYCINHKVKPQAIVAFNCGFSEFSQYYNYAPHLSNLNALENFDSPEDNPNTTSKDTWSQGLIEILQTFDAPIIFTSFTKQEADFDFAVLQSAAMRQRLKVQIDRIFKVVKNPFHDLRPLRQWYIRDKEQFYYRNGYIQAVTSKLMS